MFKNLLLLQGTRDAWRKLAGKLRSLVDCLDEADGKKDGLITRSHALPLVKAELAEAKQNKVNDAEGSNLAYRELLEGCLKQLETGAGAKSGTVQDPVWNKPSGFDIDSAVRGIYAPPPKPPAQKDSVRTL